MFKVPLMYLKSKEIPEEKKQNARNAFAFLEEFLKGNDYVAGNHYTLADFSCIATVTTLVVRESNNY
jgi:glutathione S-transferase